MFAMQLDANWVAAIASVASALVVAVTAIAAFAQIRYIRASNIDVDEFRQIGALLQFMEHLATLVVTGRISEHLVLAEYADNIGELWDQLGEIIYLRRRARGPYVGAAFEDLAMRAKRFVSGGHMDQLYGRLQKDPRLATFSP